MTEPSDIKPLIEEMLAQYDQMREAHKAFSLQELEWVRCCQAIIGNLEELKKRL